MVRTVSGMRTLGGRLPKFELPEVVGGKLVTDFGLRQGVSVVAFICNHCPYVVHIKPQLAEFGRYCDSRGVNMVAISSNDVTTHPADAPDPMTDDAIEFGYTFPYLYDELQTAALDFGATCTPEFFVFDAQAKLAYRGQFDSSRPGNGVPVTGEDVRAAVDALLAGGRPETAQKPSVGCSIKWRPENDPNR